MVAIRVVRGGRTGRVPELRGHRVVHARAEAIDVEPRSRTSPVTARAEADRQQRTRGIVRLGLRHAENRHDTVPDEADYVAVVGNHVALHDRLELGEQITCPFRADGFGEPGEAGQIQENDRDLLVHGLREKLGVGEDMRHQAGGLESFERGFLACEASRDTARLR